MDEFCLLVAIPRLRAPAKYDRLSVWCLNPGGAQTPAYTVGTCQELVRRKILSCYLTRSKYGRSCHREQRNHGLKYKSDCISRGIGIKI